MGVLDFRVIGLIKDTFTSPITHIYESDNQQHDHKKIYSSSWSMLRKTLEEEKK